MVGTLQNGQQKCYMQKPDSTRGPERNRSCGCDGAVESPRRVKRGGAQVGTGGGTPGQRRPHQTAKGTRHTRREALGLRSPLPAGQSLATSDIRDKTAETVLKESKSASLTQNPESTKDSACFFSKAELGGPPGSQGQLTARGRRVPTGAGGCARPGAVLARLNGPQPGSGPRASPLQSLGF